MKLLFVVMVVWMYFVLSNFYWYIKTKSLYARFRSSKEMSSYIPEVDELFKKAGTSYKSVYDIWKENCKQRTLQDVAYLCDSKYYKDEVNKVFLVTIGTFRMRLKHSILPIHLLFLPSYLFTQKERKVPTIFQFVLTGIYWVAGALAAYHLDALLDFVYLEYLQSIFEKLL